MSDIYYSISDLLLGQGIDIKQFCKKHKIKKGEISSDSVYCPPRLRQAICEELKITDLEFSLLCGVIPDKYRKSFIQNIPQIAKLLVPANSHPDNNYRLKPYYCTDNGTLYKGDCVQMMQNLPDECVDLIFADPPFNLKKEYDDNISDDLGRSDYIEWMHSWLDECIRILKPGGQIFVYNLPKWCLHIANYLERKLTFTNWISCNMKFALPIAGRLYPAHYGLVSFTKGIKPKVFTNQRIPMQTCRHCGGEIKDYGGYKSKMNPHGINLSDCWDDIYPVRHSSRKNRKYNELSVKMLDRIITMASNEGETVFDPFGGSGTTYAVAEMLGRKWIGVELGDCEIIKTRLENLDRDRALLESIYAEKNVLFTEVAIDKRRENGFWLPEDFIKKEQE